jgi:hypothetical protein
VRDVAALGQRVGASGPAGPTADCPLLWRGRSREGLVAIVFLSLDAAAYGSCVGRPDW